MFAALVLSSLGCGDDAAPATSERGRSGGTTRPTEASTPAARFDLSAVSPIAERFIDERDLDGAGLIVVHRDAGIVAEEYWGVFGPERVSLVASSSKMITAGVLLRLHDDGLLDIDAPVAEVADWGAGNPAVTTAQLLSNSSGLVGLSPDLAYEPYRCQFLATGTLQECAADIFSSPDDDADVVDPDTEFRYGGAQWQVAGAVAEVASGKTWAQLIDEIYVQPCGIETLAYNNHFTQLGVDGFAPYPTMFRADPSTLQPTDNPNIEGGAYIAPPDYAELLLMHLRGGRCGETQVLSQGALDRMHADRIGPAYGGNAGPGTGYGMGWWTDRASGRISDPGAYGSVPWLDLEDGYGAYLVLEADSNTAVELAHALFDVVEHAMRDH
jgi:CubicO group peptidase (beta-lactamase class C family)